MAPTLRCILESLPDALLSGPNLQDLLERLPALPSHALTSTFGIEIYLDEPSPECDFFLSVLPGSTFARYLTETPGRTEANTLPKGCIQVLRELADAESSLFRWFDAVILEYDCIGAGPAKARAPGIFLEPKGGAFLLPANGRESCRQDRIRGAETLASAICRATGRAKEPAEFEFIGNIVRSLPDSGEITHIGALPDRNPSPIRIVVSVPKTQAMAFLEQIRWKGSMPHFRRLNELCRRWQSSDQMHLSIDVDRNGVHERIGVELYLSEAWLNAGTQSWRSMLGHLVEQDWSLRNKAEALLSLRRADTLLTEAGVFRFLAGINHLKLVLDGERIGSKAYAGLFLLPA